MAFFDTVLVLFLLSMLWAATMIVTTVFHEAGHALSGWALGDTPTLYHNWVQNGDTQGWVRLTVTAAGPMASLIQGVVFAISFALMQGGMATGTSRFVVLNLACLGFSTAFGYLLITPLPGAGDMNKIAGILQLGLVWQMLLAVAGALLLTGLAKYAGNAYQTLNPFEMASQRAGLFLFSVVPWLVAAVFLTVLNGNSQDVIVRFFPFSIGFFVLIAVADGPGNQGPGADPVGWSWAQFALAAGLLLATSAAYIRLKHGITLGIPSGS